MSSNACLELIRHRRIDIKEQIDKLYGSVSNADRKMFGVGLY